MAESLVLTSTENVEESVYSEAVFTFADDTVVTKTNAPEVSMTTFNMEPMAELGNIFTFDYFQLNGQDIEDNAEIEFNQPYQLQYKWGTKDLEVKAGDTATLQLPNVFKEWPDNTPAQDIKISDGTVVGKYTISNGELHFVFNEKIEEAAVHNGFVGFNVEFDNEKFLEEWEQEIDFDGDGEKDLTVVVKPGEVETSLDKEGHPDSDKNAKEITWSVDITNGSGEALVNGLLKDVLPEGVGEPRDFIVKELTFDFEGNKVVGEEVSFNEPAVNGNEFEMTFDNVPARGGYRVEYTTTIEDYTINQFTNDATFTYDGGELETNTTVYTGERSNPIQKSGNYNWNTGQIDWTIVVNENGMAIDNAIVHDKLPEELTLVDGSIKITKNWQEVEDIDAAGFPIELGEVSADEVYRIYFSTDIDWAKVNDGEYIQNNKFVNETELTDGDNPIGEDDAEVNFWRESLLSKSGSPGDYNYDNKVLSWTLDVNKAKHPISNAVITDILPAGLDIQESDIVIKNEAGEEVIAENISITVLDDGRTEVKIELGDIGTETLQITYETEVEDFKVDDFKNEASLDGDGIGEDTPKDDATVNPPGNSFKKDFKGIDYNEKTMDWTITVDPRREAITELEIKDTFPNNGMILLPDSVVVKVGDTELTKGTDYILEPNTAGEDTGYNKGYNKGFTIILINIDEDSPLNEQLTVDFKTSYDPQLEVEGNTADDHIGDPTLYTNHADFTGKTVNGHDIDEEDDASTRVREDSWNSGKKEGQLVHEDSDGNLVAGWENGSERKIAWQLYTNYQKQNLGTDVEITDTLAYEGTIDEDSIKVSIYEVSADGETTITDEAITNYTVTVDGNKFTLTFADDFVVDERYVVEFTTTVPDISQESYKNEAWLKVDNKEYPYSGTVDYDRWDDYLDKQALGQEGTEIFIGAELEWKVTVNESLSIIKNAVINDTISAGLSYVDGSLEITSGSGSELIEDEDYTLEVSPNENGETDLEIVFENNVIEALTLNYTTEVIAENGQQVNNKVELNGDGIENKSKETDRLTAKQFSWVGGDYKPNFGAIEISKVDSITGEVITDSEATFELYRVVNDENVLMGEFTTENGILEVGNLFLGTYILKEIEAPEGYLKSEEELIIEVDEAYGPDKIVFKEEFNNISDATIGIPVLKVWEDENDQDGIRPESIEVELLANKKETDFDNLILNADNNWQGAFTGLPVLDADGEPIEYSIAELDVENGYTSEVSDNEEGGFVVTNSREPELTEISGEKIWDDADNQDGVRPEKVTVNLLANGAEVDDQVVTADEEGNWSYEFTGLPKYEAGEEITYTVTEDTVEDYTPAVDGHDIINSYTPEERSVTVTKTWDDANNQDGKRSESVDVQLFANGAEHGDPVTLSEENDWNHIWTELAVNAAGEEITYTIEELNVHEDYDVDINNENLGNVIITNSYTPEVTDVSGEKIWEDADNQDGVRPDEITVSLLANGEEIDSQDVTADDNWSYTFTDLPVYQPGEVGQEIEYTVVEAEIPEGYEVDYDGNNIINSYDPELAEVSITKEWNDEDNLAGFRPDQIEVELIADGEATGKVIAIVADEDGNWEGSFINLPKYRDEGIQIDYTVQEVSLDEDLYSVEVIPSDEDLYDFTLINTHEVERINLNGAKTWDDADNQDGVRPESITVNLLANGELVESILVTAENNWEFTFSDLPVNEAGEEISYTVTEDTIEHYSVDVNNDSYEITNSYTPEETSVTVTKAWNDANNQDGIRPESIEVQLLADGNELGDPVELTADMDWTYTWTGLDLNSAGEPITYSVKELNVPEEYTVALDDGNHGNIILTNSYNPELINISGTKTWQDANNQDGIRPESITVNLLADGVEVDSVEVTATDDWTFEFTDVPRFAVGEVGQEIDYTVEEEAIEGYEAIYDGYNITNHHDPELINIEGTKTWEDANNQDGIRPETITVNLHENGEVIDTLEVTETDEWSYTFADLPRFNDGVEIDYTVSEEAVEGYETTIDGYDITNSYTPETVEVTGVKSWNDGNNQDGIRPESITVNLLADGEIVDNVSVTAEDEWSYAFTNLAKFSDSVEIDYTVTEDAVEGYTTTVEGYDITNSYTPEVIDVSGVKTWVDDDNADEVRPESITVNLLADGEIVDSVAVSEADEWSYAFTNLAKFSNGVEVVYTVTEDAVEGYTTEVNGFDITNTFIPEDPETGGDDGGGDTPDDGEDPSEEELPQTGLNNPFNWTLISMTLMAGLALILMSFRRRINNF
ncbi:Cna B-type domain-containing protein [Aliicoccus persicus]|uniref:LPXTG-motif cell wall anchor domain-containing protein n=1 Tax=Aliicoccus persicus TaxID=930138 RepID=A0A662Z3Z4_9STAP|nr:Cna B-type domain-containing protein [Aliicoccus persicus]SEV86795.1 LPXTG-motif cell wall anchor domain-containing protein [Aliicoccus persicus]